MVKIGMFVGDRYEILEKIGAGGMSDVYRAKCHKLNRYVAVKVLKQEFSENEEFVRKFRIEAQAAAGLMHPNIVNVYDVGTEYGVHYIVMELVEGITLKQYIEKKARLSVKESISIAIQISMGIESAHNNHIIHRDIKPQNIIISKEGKVKVTDFGIAKAVTSNTITSSVMGSVHYTSPEQARGGFSDEKSDIYSLGITLFEMLTGRVPFNGESTVSIAIKHIQEPFPSVREYVAEIPVSVEHIVYKCTNKSPDRRYLTMKDLIEDLKKSLLNPNADFVKVVNPDTGASTRAISKEELQQIKQQSQRLINEEEEEIPVSEAKPLERRRVVRKKVVYAPVIEEEEDEEDEEGDYNSKMEKVTTVLAIIAAILIGAIAIFLVGKAVGVFEFGEQVVEETEEVEDNTIVTEQDEIEEVVVETSSGITIPSVTGVSLAEAVSSLEKSGFAVEQTQSYSDTVTKGNVIAQSPIAGEKAAANSVVTIEISLGKEEVKVRVPTIVGLTEEEGIIALTEAGLVVGTITEVENADATLVNKICYQSYSVGSYIDSGSTVDIKISTGTGVVSYCFVGSVASPAAEDADYAEGSSTTVVLTTSLGAEVYRQVVDSFPLEMNISGIQEATDGTLSFYYTVYIGETSEERRTDRLVKFAQE